MQLPPDHQTIMPYLIVSGADRLIEFCERVFDARLLSKYMREDQQTIMHAEIHIGGSTLMIAEAGDEWGIKNAGLFIYVDDADARFQKALAHGASSILAIRDQDYGRSGGVRDAFGNDWWITSL